MKIENQTEKWRKTFQTTLPYLALVGPVSWLVASFVRISGIGTLPGELSWISSQEGLIMTLGSPFFTATFIFIGQFVAKRFPKTGIVITTLGILGVATLSISSGFRIIATVLVQSGIDPNAIWKAYNADSFWYLPFIVLQLSGFLSFIISGVALVRTNLAPKWVGVLLILSIPTLVIGWFFLYHAEIFCPLAYGLWVLAIGALITSTKKSEE